MQSLLRGACDFAMELLCVGPELDHGNEYPCLDCDASEFVEFK